MEGIQREKIPTINLFFLFISNWKNSKLPLNYKFTRRRPITSTVFFPYFILRSIFIYILLSLLYKFRIILDSKEFLTLFDLFRLKKHHLLNQRVESRKLKN